MKAIEMTNRQANRSAPNARGFSLVEMLLVVSIVVLMAILVFPMMIKARENAQVQQTQMQLAGLHTIAGSYKLETGNFLNVRNNARPIDWSTDKTFNNPDPAFQSPNPTSGRIPAAGNFAPINDSIERFVWGCYQINDLRKSITTQKLVDLDNNGFMEVRDLWGNKIMYADYVTHGAPTNDFDFLPQYGNAAAPKPFFVSAGPDGDFGSAQSGATAAQQKATEDNIVSYDVEEVTGR